MQDTITSTIACMPGGIARDTLTKSLSYVAERLSCQMYSNSTLVIKAGGGVLAKTGAAISYGVVNGKPIIIGAGTDMPSLTGLNIGAGKFNLICFFVDAAGTLSVLMGTEGATAGAARFPSFPTGKTLVGFLSVTHSSAFTGGTTALDTATTLYFSPVGAFDPSITL